MHACMHACMHTYIHTYIHTCIHAYMHTCIHAYMHTCIHAFMRTRIHACMHACMHAYRHTYIHAYMHTCVHAYMHACMHTRTQAYNIHAYMHTYIYISHDIITCYYMKTLCKATLVDSAPSCWACGPRSSPWPSLGSQRLQHLCWSCLEIGAAPVVSGYRSLIRFGML